jgi:23S rRNA (cytosine1962-C5)-methyltransferase
MSETDESEDQGGRDPAVTLKPGREKPVRQRHPWVYSGAIRRIPKTFADGDVVPVADAKGAWLAQGYLNRRSQIQVRLLSWDPDEAIDDAFWRQRLAQAIRGRRDLAGSGTNVYRLVHAESDYLPGLTVDRYADYLVLQAGTLGMDRRKRMIAAHLRELTGCAGVIERSDTAQRKQEGLPEASGLLAGEPPPPRVEVQENGLRFLVDLEGGQKTGFYADQRANRVRAAAYCAGKDILNVFSYTGAFGVYALARDAAHVINIDASIPALELGEENLRLNGFDPDVQAESLAGDAFQILRDWRAADGPRFDVIILDPPKLATSKRSVERALRGYKDINLLAMRLLRPGGVLVTFSCSGLIDAALFQKVIFGAALDAGRQVQILEWLHQGSDHPVAVTFPEGQYLKGLICRVV